MGKPQSLKQLFFPGNNPLSPQSVDPGIEVNILRDCKILVEREFLRHVPDLFLDPFPFTINIMSCHMYLPGGGIGKSAENPDGGGLPCPVGTQETKNLSPLHMKGKPVIGGKGTKLLHQILYFNDMFALTKIRAIWTLG